MSEGRSEEQHGRIPRQGELGVRAFILELQNMQFLLRIKLMCRKKATTNATEAPPIRG
jgi:hypothetical protein